MTTSEGLAMLYTLGSSYRCLSGVYSVYGMRCWMDLNVFLGKSVSRTTGIIAASMLHQMSVSHCYATVYCSDHCAAYWSMMQKSVECLHVYQEGLSCN